MNGINIPWLGSHNGQQMHFMTTYPRNCSMKQKKKTNKKSYERYSVYKKIEWKENAFTVNISIII